MKSIKKRKKKKNLMEGGLSGQPLKTLTGTLSVGWRCPLLSHWLKTLERKEAF